jgi:glutamate-5-semialdehyde dehydrogenase
MDSNTDLRARVREIKNLAIEFANLSSAERNNLLLSFAAALGSSKDLILESNAKDLEASKSCLPESLLARLKLDTNKLQQLRVGIEDIAKLKDPLHEIELKRVLDDGLVLEKRTVPLGLVAFVFESRPDVLPQILSLCIKSGNGLISRADTRLNRLYPQFFHFGRHLSQHFN